MSTSSPGELPNGYAHDTSCFTPNFDGFIVTTGCHFKKKGPITMPMLDAYIPQGALTAHAERALISKVSDLFLEHEGVDPNNERARPLTWVFVHRPEVYVAGTPPKTPRYRFICQVPEGQYNDERRAVVTAALTQAVADAEAGKWPHPERRVCVFTLEVPDGWWGGAGQILRLPDIYELIWPLHPGMAGDARQAAAAVLAARRGALNPYPGSTELD